MSTDEALALILDYNLTKASYQLMKNKANEKECNSTQYIIMSEWQKIDAILKTLA